MITPNSLLQFFNNNNFEYGFIKDGKKYRDDDIDFTNYETMHPLDVMKYKIGTCWDYTTVEHLLFKKYLPDIYTECLYIEADDSSTHTWLIFYQNRKIYIFEYSWYDYRGIFEFNSFPEMLNYYIIHFLKSVGSPCHAIAVYKYIPPNQYHLSPDAFMHYVTTTGQLIKSTNSYHETIIRSDIEYESKYL